MLKRIPMIYQVCPLKLFEKPYYFITRHDIFEFDHYITKHFDNWICYEWWGYIDPFKHKVIKHGGSTRYWRDGKTTNR